MFQNKKIFILGMARSGFEAAKLLAAHNNQILLTDQREQDIASVNELDALGVSLVVTNDPIDLIDDTYDYLIKNPGINRDHPCVQKALKLNIPVINEIEMAYHFLPKDVSIIGVTGSNGKTTTVTIMYNLLKGANLPVHLGGNIGYPLSGLVNKVKNNDILVLEISDHQLHDMYDFKTSISVLTNLSEVHLDFNKTYQNYKNIKKRIFQNHTNKDIAILNLDNDDVIDITSDLLSKKIYFSSTKDADICIKNNSINYMGNDIIEIDDIRVKGQHNYENIMCAITVAKEFNVSDDVIKSVLNDFSGVEHRLEYVKRIDNREFYNDSKSTNNQSTITALGAFTKPIILILGGLDRGQSFDELTPYMDNVKQVISYGETKNKIEEYCKSIGLDCIVVNELRESVKAASNMSEIDDVILFSPACASWDQFKSFEERGELYKKYIEELKVGENYEN